jgi:hypothetical protein
MTRLAACPSSLPIGRGNDAMAYDSIRHRVFSSNCLDGTVSVYQQRSPDHYAALNPIKTELTGRTMSLDPETGRLFVAAATAIPARRRYRVHASGLGR